MMKFNIRIVKIQKKRKKKIKSHEFDGDEVEDGSFFVTLTQLHL